MAVADETLHSALRDYTRDVVASHSYDELCRLHSCGEASGNFAKGTSGEADYLEFGWSVVGIEMAEGLLCMRIHTCVSDDRCGGLLGSFRTPLGSGAFVRPDGTADYFGLGNTAVTAKEIDF